MFVGSGAFFDSVPPGGGGGGKTGGWHWVHWTASVVGGIVHGGVYALVPPWSMVKVVEGRGEEDGERERGQA